MKIDKGTLKKTKSGYVVTVPAKKKKEDENRTVDKQIPNSARCFDIKDAANGIEVDVERDDKDQVTKVTIPDKPVVSPQPPPKPQFNHGFKGKPPYHGGPQTKNGGTPVQQEASRGKPKARPSIIGLEFHNPYTFLPFSNTAPKRHEPTPLSVDELPQERGRLTGVLEIEVTTESPLLTCDPEPIEKNKKGESGHKTYRALAIGPDVVVPATGIRGSLRTLLTILTGGTLGYLNQQAYLCQGRDANLGPRGLKSPAGTPKNVFLAEVITPGTSERPGTVRLGRTELVKADDLKVAVAAKPELKTRCEKYATGSDAPLPRKVDPSANPNILYLWAGMDTAGNITDVGDTRTPGRPWKIKLSGRPVPSKRKAGQGPPVKREGVFLAGEKTLTLPPELWGAYSGRNVHGDRPELENRDLVWLEPMDPETDKDKIDKPEQVKSIQWARWGRRGQTLKELMHNGFPQVLPDYLQPDGLVDEVTDLFGQVSSDRDAKAPMFAARLRPENLVFRDAASNVERVTLTPLAAPHPGCIAFYRDNPSADDVSDKDTLRGYKVYRTTKERGTEAPWRYDVQGIYDNSGLLRRGPQKMNKTCDLVPEGQPGKLRIAFRGLSLRELALVLQACQVPWRLGGGKPLGLGLCKIRVRKLIGEDGQPLQVPGWTILPEKDGSLRIDGWQSLVGDLRDRVRMWEASQEPVAKLRYPRAVDKNKNSLTRGGHTWFKCHASPRKVDPDGTRERGLEAIHIAGDLVAIAQKEGEVLDSQDPMIRGQVLPPFDPAQPYADVLYGYDGFGIEGEDTGQQRTLLRIEPFDEGHHPTGQEQSEGNQGKDRNFRKNQKRRRGEGQ